MAVRSKPRNVWSFVTIVWLIVLAFNVSEGFGWIDGRPHPFNQACAAIGGGGGLVILAVAWYVRVTDRRTAALIASLRQGAEMGMKVALKVDPPRPPSTLNAYRPPTDAQLRRWATLDRDSPSWRN